MKKFDFIAKLKGLDLSSLKNLKNYHLNLMFKFMGFDDKEYAKHLRYLGYIEDKIKKIKSNQP